MKVGDRSHDFFLAKKLIQLAKECLPVHCHGKVTTFLYFVRILAAWDVAHSPASSIG
jgi:hypothetical protein